MTAIATVRVTLRTRDTAAWAFCATLDPALALSWVDGAPLSDADLVACDAAAVALDELEALADHARRTAHRGAAVRA